MELDSIIRGTLSGGERRIVFVEEKEKRDQHCVRERILPPKNFHSWWA